MPVAFGASVDGVRALLPHRRIDETSRPSLADVERFLAQGSGWVALRLGYPTSFEALDPDDQRPHFEALAAGLVELYAGAFAEDAAHPEQAGPGESSYGSILWERFLRGIDELLEALGKATDTGGGGEEPAAGHPGTVAYSFPPPTFRTIPTPPFTAPNVGATSRTT